ncbi:MAG: S24 family peptidase [Eubacterium sp.]|nr:S24 family peptidase [Eubacterium sp.]
MEWNDNVEPFDFVKEFDPEAPLPIKRRGGFDFLTVILKDHSMFDRYFKEDLLNIRLQDHCDDNQEALVMIGGGRVTLRIVQRDGDDVTLLPFNREFYETETLPADQIQILGVVQNAIRIN